ILFFFFFFFNDTATTEIYTLSLHDALPIRGPGSTFGLRAEPSKRADAANPVRPRSADGPVPVGRSSHHRARSARVPDGPPVSFDAPGGCAYKERHARSPRPGPASRRLSLAPRGRG